MAIKTKLDQLKYEAKQYKRAHGLTHAQALEDTARRHGFSNYHEAQKRLKDIPRDKP